MGNDEAVANQQTSREVSEGDQVGVKAWILWESEESKPYLVGHHFEQAS
jgi:hypothetical protein